MARSGLWASEVFTSIYLIVQIHQLHNQLFSKRSLTEKGVGIIIGAEILGFLSLFIIILISYSEVKIIRTLVPVGPLLGHYLNPPRYVLYAFDDAVGGCQP
jgi:hypothetical protein